MSDIGKLNEGIEVFVMPKDSHTLLKEALGCIAATIDAALEACFNNEEEWKATRTEIFDSWTLITGFFETTMNIEGKTLDEGKKTCCVREECEWMDGKGENDHGCIGFVQDAIFAQIEDLPHEQGILVLKSALDLLEN
jgi:hypothetical protein